MRTLSINHDWKETFRNAVAGFLYAFRTQKNFAVHLIISLLVIALAITLEISPIKFVLLIFAITFGLTIEMANTAFEKIVDIISPQYSPAARIAKDMAAGMMLVAAVGLAILGLMILLPPLLRLFLS